VGVRRAVGAADAHRSVSRSRGLDVVGRWGVQQTKDFGEGQASHILTVDFCDKVTRLQELLQSISMCEGKAGHKEQLERKTGSTRHDKTQLLDRQLTYGHRY